MSVPNAHGVYESLEHFVCPNPTKGWRGSPLASIDLLRLDDGWRAATTSCLPNGSGHAYPMMRHREVTASRDIALADAVELLRRKMAGEDCQEAGAVRRWLDNLAPAQRDLFEIAA